MQQQFNQEVNQEMDVVNQLILRLSAKQTADSFERVNCFLDLVAHVTINTLFENHVTMVDKEVEIRQTEEPNWSREEKNNQFKALLKDENWDVIFSISGMNEAFIEKCAIQPKHWAVIIRHQILPETFWLRHIDAIENLPFVKTLLHIHQGFSEKDHRDLFNALQERFHSKSSLRQIHNHMCRVFIADAQIVNDWNCVDLLIKSITKKTIYQTDLALMLEEMF